MLKAYKYRIYPDEHQRKFIEKTFGCTRLVYNLALATKIEAYKSSGKNLSAIDLCYQLKELKQEYTWLTEVDSQALQAAVKKVDRSYQNFFRGKGFPKFKSKHSKQSFQCPNNKREVNWDNLTLTIPKIKDIPIRLSRKFDGNIKTVTISKTPTGKYFASILVDNGLPLPKRKPVKKAIGLDAGLKHFIITSDGIKVDSPRYYREALHRLKILQKRASRKKKGSNNRIKANFRVAKQHEKIKNKRLDYLHKLSSRLVGENQTDTFFIEDLNIKGMLSNHNLALSISDASWSEFYRMMEYKCNWTGKNLIKINRWSPSSKQCIQCGSIKEDLTLADRVYECKNCGNVIDRDVMAAKNILNFGLNNISRTGSPGAPVEPPSLEGAEKQEFISVN